MKTILSIIGLLALCALEFFLARRGKKWLGWLLPVLSFLGSTAFYVCNLRMPEGGSVDSFLLTALLGFFMSNILTLILLAVYFVAHEKQQDKKDQHL